MKYLLLALLLALPASAAQFVNVRSVSTDTTAAITDDTINVSATSAQRTVTIPIKTWSDK